MSKDSDTLTLTTPFSVDNWQVSPCDNQVTHLNHDESRTLEPRLMRLLCALATSPRHVVDRDSLIDAVWPKVIVNENSLTRAVSDLRKALHTDAVPGKQLIETVPKRGYRLMAEVRMLPASSVELGHTSISKHETTTDTISLPSQQATWQRWLPAMAASLLLIITAAIQLPGRLFESPTLITATDRLSVQQTSNSQPDMIIGQPRVQARNALAEQSTLSTTNTFHWHDEQEDGYDSLNLLDSDTSADSTAAVLAPEGNLLAYVEQINDANRLMLRPTYSDAKPWTAFTTDETILQLQWSPLGDGVLFTLQGTAEAGSQKPGHRYRRLMLLDIQTLALHELYRKDDMPATTVNHAGNLT